MLVFEHLPINRVQLGALRGVEHLLSSSELSSHLTNYLVSCKVEGKAEKTISTYRDVIVAFGNFAQLHGFPDEASELTPNHVRQFLYSLQTGGRHKPATVHIHYRSLKTFFNWLIAEKTLTENPMAAIKPPKVPKQVIKPFTNQNIRDMLALCSGNTFNSLRNKAMVLILLDTGLRFSEFAGIQLGDINFDNGTIMVMGKGAKERYVRIGKRTQKSLLRYILARDDEHPCLWVTEERQPMRKWGIKMVIRRLCQRVNVKGAKPGPHTFRHTAAINYLRNGGDEFTLQIMLGHSTLQMTRRYVSSLGTEDMIRVHEKASPVDNMKL